MASVRSTRRRLGVVASMALVQCCEANLRAYEKMQIPELVEAWHIKRSCARAKLKLALMLENSGGNL